ncbi:phycobiliprotein lyase [Gloeocapsopsis dulcis]|uniref:Chromophore lyase CpcS/CpeS n=1 Tax=Gloeocapsopsis dulcis AAB1 = 1H9 TaxID=1433147 RepID=A0A6N8FTP1_9CHRO|nr:phycobiliprotein lyase [Gloeocapsopsis dulcis]MUL36134.1 phycobiliprotein lyase [Gloeocapsopsis dulcis AAB1 = 1H9]WNN91392.1 phycobiliprotein lyase [Gloeocapsopsis dulcis]
MLTFPEFFTACSGKWTTERTYLSMPQGSIERSYTEYHVEPITLIDKQRILTLSTQAGIKLEVQSSTMQQELPGFAISFDTRSETGETVSMSLQALFVPDMYISAESTAIKLPPPVAAQVVTEPQAEVIQGFYLRDEGYSETGTAVGRFTYQPTRQTLEMTTYYRRSVAVDQMRMVAPNLRLRTIITYQRPENVDEIPTTIDLVGFGVEQRSV